MPSCCGRGRDFCKRIKTRTMDLLRSAMSTIQNKILSSSTPTLLSTAGLTARIETELASIGTLSQSNSSSMYARESKKSVEIQTVALDDHYYSSCVRGYDTVSISHLVQDLKEKIQDGIIDIRYVFMCGCDLPAYVEIIWTLKPLEHSPVPRIYLNSKTGKRVLVRACLP